MKTPASVQERLEANIERIPFSGCWIWTGHTRSGYGRMLVGSRSDGSRRLASVHRLTYEAANGTIPSNLELDHLCRVRCCCNPQHLEPVNRLENVRRSPIHNGAKTHCKHGHAFTEQNTILFANGKHRKCRACKNEQSNRAYHGLR